MTRKIQIRLLFRIWITFRTVTTTRSWGRASLSKCRPLLRRKRFVRFSFNSKTRLTSRWEGTPRYNWRSTKFWTSKRMRSNWFRTRTLRRFQVRTWKWASEWSNSCRWTFRTWRTRCSRDWRWLPRRKGGRGTIWRKWAVARGSQR